MEYDIVKIGIDRFKSKRREVIHFVDDDNANKLLCDLENNPHVFVLACLMDRQIKSEKAWMIPQKIFDIVGTHDFFKLKNIKQEEISKIFLENKLHRFNNDMAQIFYSGIKKIEKKYYCDASNIWNNKPSSASVVYSFLDFNGCGIKIATMASNILARQFKIKFSDYYSIDISPDVHIKRVLSRMGFVPNNPSSEMVIYKARELYPKFPGIIDFSCWEIGRKYCHVSKPDCRNCIVNFECKNKTINIEDELKNIIGFSFSSGGFHVEYKTIKIDIEDNKIICKYISEINDNRGERIFEITNSIWNNFIKSIIKLNILKWDKEYDDPYIRDGIQWNIEIKYKNKSVEIYGNNRYPREWNNFIKTIEKYFLLIK